MKFIRAANLAVAILAGHSVAADPPFCPAGATSVFGSNAGSLCCPPLMQGKMNGPRGLKAADPPTCEGTDIPPCCTAKEAGPPVVETGGTINLQCGSTYDPEKDSHDIPNGVTYEVKPCINDTTAMCLHAKAEAAPDVKLANVYLNIGKPGDSLPSTDPRNWPFNKYCEASGSVGSCSVPLEAIEAVLSVTSLCGSSIEVAFGISARDSCCRCDTCFGQGSPLAGTNGAMSSIVSFGCPEVCTEYCCCDPPLPGVVCEVGTAYGYGPGYADFNGDPVGPAISPLPNNCKKWGFYFPLTPAQMAAGLTGILHAGAGTNDLTKGQPVGTFTAALSGTNLDVTYSLFSGFDLAEVHVYASCLMPTTCAPGQFTYTGSDLDLSGTDDTSFAKSIAIAGSPPCDTYYLIFHAKVNLILPPGSTCPPPVNDD